MFEHNLTSDEIARYSRQLIIAEFGVDSQVKLKSSSALVIGCGGLGCTAALYLAMCGIGKLGLVDHDHIEISNIHRQLAHTENQVGVNKAQNLANECKQRNSLVNCFAHEMVFDQSIGCNLIRDYDVILDCTDNVVTRYLINDCCVIMNKPLVCGSALKFDGQLTIYNYNDGPCMRCVYPKPPPKETVSNCLDAGILGPVVGTIGNLQAMEAIKIIANIGECLSGRLLLFNALHFMTRIVRLRAKSKDCVVCSGQVNSIQDFDYVQFCNNTTFDDKTPALKLLTNEERIAVQELKQLRDQQAAHVLLDVRPVHEFKICSLKDSLNISIDDLKAKFDATSEVIREKLNDKQTDQLLVICRRGNDSQIVTQMLKNRFQNTNNNAIVVKDVIGGLTAWTNHVDTSFPKY